MAKRALQSSSSAPDAAGETSEPSWARHEHGTLTRFLSLKQQKLPDELWSKVFEDVDDNSVTAFACTCKQLRRVQRESGRRLETNLSSYYEESWSLDPMQVGVLSEDWCDWAATCLVRSESGLFSEDGIQFMRAILNAAAFWGHLSFLRENLSTSLAVFAGDCCRFAAGGGHLSLLQWLRENDFPWDRYTCSSAAARGHLGVLQWARANGCPMDGNTCDASARSGNLEILQWARANGCPWNEYTLNCAVFNGHLHVVQWCHENGCPWNLNTSTFAAFGGYLEILQYAHERGCPWDESTCSGAAERGHLDVLKYARENGCPWDDECCTTAAIEGHLPILQWCVAKGCPWNPEECREAVKETLESHRAAEIIAWIDTHCNSVKE